LSRYPFLDRWILWIVPLVVLVICAGVDQLSRMAPPRVQRPVLFLAAAGLLVYPFFAGINLTFRNPSKVVGMRDALQYLDKQESSAKVLYYNAGAESLLDFYLQSRSWTNLRETERRVLQVTDTDALTLPADAHGKVWIVLGDAPDSQAVDRLIANIGARGRVIQRRENAGAAALIVTAETTTAQARSNRPSYPLKVSADGRYLVDQNNTPFFIVGDAAWSLITELSNSDVEVYLADRASRGFNVLWVTAADNKFSAIRLLTITAIRLSTGRTVPTRMPLIGPTSTMCSQGLQLMVSPSCSLRRSSA
jgi:hypothetical protein